LGFAGLAAFLTASGDFAAIAKIAPAKRELGTFGA
jgi:hypothetical protein